MLSYLCCIYVQYAVLVISVVCLFNIQCLLSVLYICSIRMACYLCCISVQHLVLVIYIVYLFNIQYLLSLLYICSTRSACYLFLLYIYATFNACYFCCIFVQHSVLVISVVYQFYIQCLLSLYFSVDVQYSLSQVIKGLNNWTGGFKTIDASEHSLEVFHGEVAEEDSFEGGTTKRLVRMGDQTAVKLNGTISVPWILQSFINRTTIESYVNLLDNLESVIRLTTDLC